MKLGPRFAKVLKRLAAAVALLFTALVLGATLARGPIAREIVARKGPGRPAQDPSPEVLARWGVKQQLRVDVGPPAASLLVWMLEPEGGVDATVMVLHGIAVDMESMLRVEIPQAALRERLRVILVEPRGHGLSSGDWITFGAIEAADLSRVVDALLERRLVEGPLGVYGLSYGAALAVQLAGRDPRVRGAVAVAPFRSLRAVVPAYAKALLPVVGGLLPGFYLDGVVDRAGEAAGFDPEAASPERAIARSGAPVLLVHGSADQHIPPSHTEALRRAGGARVEVRLVEGADHFSVVGTASAKEDAFRWLREVLVREGSAG